MLGVLSVTVNNAAQAAGLLRYRNRNRQGLTVLSAPEVVIDVDAPEIPVGVDGEALSVPTPVHSTVQPQALRVLVPRNRPGLRQPKPPMNWRQLRELALTMTRTARGASRHD